MKNIKSEYVWTKNEIDIKIVKSWENIVNQIIYDLEHSRGFGTRKMILNKYLHKDILNWFTMNEEKKDEIRISPIPGYYGSYVILRKEKKEKKLKINFDEFKPSKTLVERYSLLLEMLDNKIPLKVKLLINEYLSDIKKDLPDDIFDSERDVIHNFYLWVKKCVKNVNMYEKI